MPSSNPPPTEQCYLEVDDAYASWHLKRFGKDIDQTSYVIPLGRALQGHPEAGAWWEKMANTILRDPELGFKATTHEHNLYCGNVCGEVYVCQQVDDFSIALDTRETADYIVSVVSSHATTTSQGIGNITINGAHCCYNGVDIWQPRNYVKISCKTYIDCLLQTHGWSAPSPNKSNRHNCIPLSSDTANSLQLLQGPDEGTKEHTALEILVGFPYRQVLGELMYVYVVCRLDIGFAVMFLACFSGAPVLEHYQALESTCKYLRLTKSWGIHYWRPSHRNDLPKVDPPVVPYDGSLPQFPWSDLCCLVAYSDAAYAADVKTRKLVTGLSLNYAGGCVAYKSKMQATVATSSTEAEFITAISAAKIIKYQHYVLQELGLEEVGPTILYIDNQATMHMINDNKPTLQSCHIDIQHFPIQEWHDAGVLISLVSSTLATRLPRH
jgi:ribosomal protein L30/L7E